MQIFRTVSVDSIVAGLRDTVERLQIHAVHKTDELLLLKEQIHETAAERDKAERVLSKLKEIIS
jgi:hypothetical protein